jgi:hypothetical protein
MLASNHTYGNSLGNYGGSPPVLRHIYFSFSQLPSFYTSLGEKMVFWGIDNCSSCVAHTWNWILDASQGGELDGHMDDTEGRV